MLATAMSMHDRAVDHPALSTGESANYPPGLRVPSRSALDDLLAERAVLLAENQHLRAEVVHLRGRAWCRDAHEHFGRSFIEAAGT